VSTEVRLAVVGIVLETGAATSLRGAQQTDFSRAFSRASKTHVHKLLSF
jgi:hypothetical protein